LNIGINLNAPNSFFDQSKGKGTENGDLNYALRNGIGVFYTNRTIIDHLVRQIEVSSLSVGINLSIQQSDQI
jgi:hypothetical protein